MGAIFSYSFARQAHERLDAFAQVRRIGPRRKVDQLGRPNSRGGCDEQRIEVGEVTEHRSLRDPGTSRDLGGARQVYHVGRAFPHDVENGTHNGLIVSRSTQPTPIGFLVIGHLGTLEARAFVRPAGTSAGSPGVHPRAGGGSAFASSGSWWPEHGRLWCLSDRLSVPWAWLWSRGSPSVTSG